MELVVDLHGFHPSDLFSDERFTELIKQAWETGEPSLRLIHGHGRNRGKLPGFVNTNTGYLGLEVRRFLRHNDSLRQWIKRTTLDCSHDGSTTIKLKKNLQPTRAELDESILGEPSFAS